MTTCSAILGRHLEAGTVYQGAPAEVSSVEQLRCC